MLFFKSRAKSTYTDFSAIETDMHSHLIPGVDDGAKDIDDSIRLVSGLTELGFSRFYTTPHTLQEIHPNTRESLTAAHSLLNGKLDGDIQLGLSSEYYLDEQFKDQLDADSLLPLPGNRLLVEFNQISQPFDLEDMIFQIGLKGYQIVLAHPERYLFFHSKFNYYNRLKEMGLEFQVNALSLTDHYGKHVRATAEKLIDKNMIDFIGTDIHHARHLPLLKRVPESRYFARLVDSGLLKNKYLV